MSDTPPNIEPPPIPPLAAPGAVRENLANRGAETVLYGAVTFLLTAGLYYLANNTQQKFMSVYNELGASLPRAIRPVFGINGALFTGKMGLLSGLGLTAMAIFFSQLPHRLTGRVLAWSIIAILMFLFAGEVLSIGAAFHALPALIPDDPH